METIIAIDLGKFKSVACVYGVADGHREFVTLPTRPQALHDLVVERGPGCVLIEVCAIAGWVYDLISSLNVEVKVANTNDEKWNWRTVKRKTDRDDAAKLLDLFLLGRLPEVHLPTAVVRQKRSFIKYRKSVVERLTAVKNSIRAILDGQGLPMRSGSSGWSATSLAELNDLARSSAQVGLEDLWRYQLGLELGQYDALQNVLKEIEAKLDTLARADEQIRILQTAPGVGRRLAEAVAAFVDTPERFASGKQVGCYVGFTPRLFQSGTMNRSGRISGRGNSLLRSLLVEVCWLGLRWNPWIKATYERIRRNSKTRKKIAIVAVARKLLVRLWAMLRDGTAWRESPAAAVS